MLSRCSDILIRRYSTFLYNYPQVFLILTPVFLIICVIFSVPSIGPDLPDFSKPTEGFEPRGTDILNRVVTHQNTLKAAIRRKELTCEYQTETTTRKRRESQMLHLPDCKINSYRAGSVVTIYESGGDLFNADDLKTICKMEERIVRATPGFNFACSCYGTNSSIPKCGPSLSLGTYIASIRKRSSCLDITPADVNYARKLLETCAPAYFSGKRTDTTECAKKSDFITNVFEFLVDIDFMRNTKVLKSTIVLSPRHYDSNFARDIYDRHLSGDRPEQNGVKLVAFKFGKFKFDEFNRKLLLDAIFPAIGLVMVALILMVYAQSVVVMALTIFSIITSVIIAYFIYHQIFQLTFFPFLNIMTFVFLVGIGADDAFVFNDAWKQAKLSLPNGNVVDWIEYTLKHAALSMFVPSFTTSAAFYANIVSDITSIRLFGIFAGTSILIMYSLMITWFPAGVIFMEKRRHTPNVVARIVAFRENPVVDIATDEMPPASNGDQSLPSCHPTKPKNAIGHPSDTSFTSTIQFNSPAWPSTCYSKVRSKCSKLIGNLFKKWIPTSLRGYPIWLAALLALGIGMGWAVMVSPGLQRPKSPDFQLFLSSHILEQYDLKYKDEFRLERIAENNFYAYIFFGFKAEDNGNYLDPMDYGKLQYDNSLDIVQPKAQKWLFEDLCSNIRKQKFFGKNISWNCFPEIFKQQCTSNTNWVLPFNQTQLNYCLKNYYDQLPCPHFHETRSSLFFQGNKIKGISLPFPTNVALTNKYETVDSLWSDIEEFSNNVLEKAPKGLENGWAISLLQLYALQKNLGSSTFISLGASLAMAFCVMLLTSLNWVISTYAIVTIFCTVTATVGSLVLVGWELNIWESIVISVAVGLSVDFTLHYAVAYNIASEKGRVDQVKYAFSHIGPAVTLAALTTFIAGVFSMFSTIRAYVQLGQFLTLVMTISWLYSTFFFMSLCYFAGPVGHFGQINSMKCVSCKITD